MEKTYQPKLRRCSSVDDHSPVELIPDINQGFVFKPEHGDIDSGTEEFEQQLENPRFSTSNDTDDQFSVQSFGPNPDEGFSEFEREEDLPVYKIQNDLELAKHIINETKKDFCADTRVAFHGEFARLIAVPLSLYYNVRYYLFAQEEIDPEFYTSIKFEWGKVDNVKAQFKCPNVRCQHAWTSMRSRILFSITNPTIGFIALKIFGQNCQQCGTSSDALWYIDEVCRVMKNLAQVLFEKYFPDMLNTFDFQHENSFQSPPVKPTRHPNHDPSQRKGKVSAPHNKQFCEACRLGLCFA